MVGHRNESPAPVCCARGIDVRDVAGLSGARARNPVGVLQPGDAVHGGHRVGAAAVRPRIRAVAARPGSYRARGEEEREALHRWTTCGVREKRRGCEFKYSLIPLSQEVCVAGQPFSARGRPYTNKGDNCMGRTLE